MGGASRDWYLVSTLCLWMDVLHATCSVKQTLVIHTSCMNGDTAASEVCDLANLTQFRRACVLRNAVPDFRIHGGDINETAVANVVSHFAHTWHGLPFPTCAVVSSSGAMLGSQCGVDVDAHEIVARVNAPKIGKHAIDVGKKTTIVGLNTIIMNRVILGYRRVGSIRRHVNMFGSGIALTLGPTTSGVSVFFKKTSNVNFFKRRFRASAVIIPKGDWFARRFRRWWALIHNSASNTTAIQPTSGVVLAVMLSSMCARVDMYGFQPRKQGQPYRYWEPKYAVRNADRGREDVDFEHRVLAAMISSTSGEQLVAPICREASYPR